MSQIIFSILLAITLGVFAYSAFKIYQLFRLTKPAYPVRDYGKRIKRTIINGFFQERIFRNPIAGFMHAMVFWGFCLILVGSIEMVIDGIIGSERILSELGIIYNIFMAGGDIFAYIIAVFIVVFIIRRSLLNIKRLNGKELKHKNHVDAYIALSFILILMLQVIAISLALIL